MKRIRSENSLVRAEVITALIITAALLMIASVL